MKTSLDKLQLVEDCLSGRSTGSDQALFKAMLLLDPEFGEDVYWQRKAYVVIREYGRTQFRNELDRTHQTLFTAPQHRSFRDKILGFFRK